MITPRDELHVLTGSYAVHALEHREREAFERHLQGCESCEAEVRAFRETAARLAMAQALQPPAGMEQRVLAATYRTRQLPPLLARERRARWRSRAGRRWAADAAAGCRRRGRQRGRGPRPRRHAGRPPSTGSMRRGPAAPRSPGSSGHPTPGSRPWRRLQGRNRQRGGLRPAARRRRQRQRDDGPARRAGLPAVGDRRGRGALGGPAPVVGQAGPVLASGVLPGDRIGITVEPSGGTSSRPPRPVVVLPA